MRSTKSPAENKQKKNPHKAACRKNSETSNQKSGYQNYQTQQMRAAVI